MLISAKSLTTIMLKQPRLRLSNVSSSLNNNRSSENNKRSSKQLSDKDKNKRDNNKLRLRSAGKLKKLKESEFLSYSDNNKKLLLKLSLKLRRGPNKSELA